jgi:uncharacterized protein YndB with AHSA1/START domain
MTLFSTQVSIAAAPERVWLVLCEFERWPEWTSSMRRLERLSSGRIGVGSRVRIEQPKLKPAEWTITAWNPEHDFTWVTRSPGVRTCAEHVVEPVAGGSNVTLTIRFEGFLGGLLALLAGSLTKRYLTLEAGGLKQQCENAAS